VMNVLNWLAVAYIRVEDNLVNVFFLNQTIASLKQVFIGQ